jgi:two-component system response regulator
VSGWVLAVDDSQDDRELLRHAWRRAALTSRLETVDGGAQALARLELVQHTYDGDDAGPPCVILLDLKMPQIDGLQVLTRVRALRWLYSVPVVILTSSAEPTDLVRSYSLGANGFVVKPVDIDDFFAVIAVAGRYWTAVNEPPPQESHARTVEGAPGRGQAG